MNPLTEERINEVHALCWRFGVQRLDVFGSAATVSFDPATSDIDFIVEFEDARSVGRPRHGRCNAKPLLHRIGQSLAPSGLCGRARRSCWGAHRPARKDPCVALGCRHKNQCSPAVPSHWLMALRRAPRIHSLPLSRLKVGYSRPMIWLSIAQVIAKAASANLP